MEDVMPAEDSFEETDVIPEVLEPFIEQYVRVKGEHMLLVGITRSGKTQKLRYLVGKFVQYAPEETILWIDCGKSSEFMGTFQYGVPVRLHVPAGCDLTLHKYKAAESVPHDVRYFNTPIDVFNQIKRGAINILVAQPFFLDYEDYSRFMAQFFKALIYQAHHGLFRKLGILPLMVVCDEFQDICPSQGLALDPTHLHSAKLIAYNLKKLRSIGIRLMAAGQAWVEILPAARRSFNWIMVCRHAFFEKDQPKLMGFNAFWQGLEIWQGALVFPNRVFPGIWKFPFLGDGEVFGYAEYHGIMTYEKEQPKVKRPGKKREAETPPVDVSLSYG